MSTAKSNPSSLPPTTKRKKRKKMYPGHKTWPMRTLKKLLVPVSFAFCGGVLLASQYAPSDEYRAFARKFFTLQYAQGTTPETYGRGPLDALFVLFSVFALTAGRALLSELVFRPMAHAVGVRLKEVGKFVEQGWQVMYYAGAFSVGFYFMNKWEFDMRAFFLEHPAPPCEALLKTFYLVQLSFWLHMIPVTLVEPWRADFVEMMLHHLITSGMIASSYTLNFLKIGVAVFAEQDFADIFLPFAKMFKYARKQAIADVVFGIFALAWIPTRHGLFFIIYYTVGVCFFLC